MQRVYGRTCRSTYAQGIEWQQVQATEAEAYLLDRYIVKAAQRGRDRAVSRYPHQGEDANSTSHPTTCLFLKPIVTPVATKFEKPYLKYVSLARDDQCREEKVRARTREKSTKHKIKEGKRR